MYRGSDGPGCPSLTTCRISHATRDMPRARLGRWLCLSRTTAPRSWPPLTPSWRGTRYRAPRRPGRAQGHIRRQGEGHECRREGPEPAQVPEARNGAECMVPSSLPERPVRVLGRLQGGRHRRAPEQHEESRADCKGSHQDAWGGRQGMLPSSSIRRRMRRRGAHPGGPRGPRRAPPVRRASSASPA